MFLLLQQLKKPLILVVECFVHLFAFDELSGHLPHVSTDLHYFCLHGFASLGEILPVGSSSIVDLALLLELIDLMLQQRVLALQDLLFGLQSLDFEVDVFNGSLPVLEEPSVAFQPLVECFVFLLEALHVLDELAVLELLLVQELLALESYQSLLVQFSFELHAFFDDAALQFVDFLQHCNPD